MPSDLSEQIEAKIAAFRCRVEAALPQWRTARDPVAIRNMELEIAATSRALADGLMGALLRDIAADPKLRAEAMTAAQLAAPAQGRSLRDGGSRQVTVTLLGGGTVALNVEYLQPNHRNQKKNRGKCRGKHRRKHQTKRGRGPGGSGLYPTLAALGIWFGVTPALSGEVCRQVADSDSVRAGRAALERHGIDLGHKQTLGLVNAFSHRAVEQRRSWLDRARMHVASGKVLRGLRVVVATDGGRLRQRVPAKAGRRRANGHQRYDAPWVEPKLLVIYVIDANGRIAQTFRPVYDGTQGDCDAIFEMMTGYLKVLGAHQARELIFLGDGAKWIWERAAQLATDLGLPPEKLVEVVDKCHAVQTLHEIADLRKGWSAQERANWLKDARRLLRAGSISALVAHIHGLATGRNAKEISSHEDYFGRNAKRMQYRAFVARKVPIGSGAVESAVRRVINMRLKSNAMFWLEVNAEGVLLLRSYLKAGRFDDLVNWSLAAAVPWWTAATSSSLGPLEGPHEPLSASQVELAPPQLSKAA
jgi:hypothetical protein